MATRMVQRKGTYQQWYDVNPILNSGEIGFESDSGKFKIGDASTPWRNLPYFINNDQITILTQNYATEQYVDGAISGIIDGAPGLLNTLNELAAAVNDDPAFFTTVSTNLSNHQSDTTNVHGIADTSLLATQEYVDGAVSGVTTDLTQMAGVGLDYNVATDQFDIDSTVATKTYADSAVSIHSSDTTSVHGIANTANLVSTTDTGTVTSNMIADGTIVNADINNSAAIAQSKIANLTTDLAAKAPLANPIFTGTVDFTGATVTGIPLPSSATPTTLGTVYGLTQTDTQDKNTILGYDALSGANKGQDNVAIGFNAFKQNTGYDYTVAVGSNALASTKYAQKNTAVGYYSLSTNESGDGNTALGYGAGWGAENANGSNNVIIGKDTMNAMTSASYNTVVGTGAAGYLTTGTYNVAIGTQALFSSTTSSGNVAVGGTSLYSNTTGIRNTAIGSGALYATTTAEGNTAVGDGAGYAFTTGHDNTIIGKWAGQQNTTGSYNTVIGSEALSYQNTETGITAIGANSLSTLRVGGNNTAVGYSAGYNSYTLIDSVLLGSGAGAFAGSYGGAQSSNLIIIGTNASPSSNNVSNEITLGDSNITKFRIPGLAIDWDSTNVPGAAATPTTLGTVYGLTDTGGNVALGRFSSLTGGNWNIAIGDNAMKNNTDGSNNVSIGESSMADFSTGDSNTAVGDYSLNSIVDSQDNTAIGGGALIKLWSGYKNTALGSQAGTIVGGFSGSNNLLLGADSSPSSGTVSNEVTIGNQDITRFRIPGLSVDWSTSAYGRATYASTSAPSGGNDGDLWIVYS